MRLGKTRISLRLLTDVRLLASGLDKVDSDFLLAAALELVQGSNALDEMFGVKFGVFAPDRLHTLSA